MSFWLVIHSNKQTPSLFPQQGERGSAAYCNDQWGFQRLTKCRSSSCRAVLRGPSETRLVWSRFGNSLISHMCPWGCEFTNSRWLVRGSFYHVDWWTDCKGMNLPSVGDVSVWLRFFPAGTMKEPSCNALVSPSLSASPQMHSEVLFHMCFGGW